MARVRSATLVGVRGEPIEVEVRLSSQLPQVDVVGLPEMAVRESVSRIRGAIAATGRTFPDRRVTVNLAPAELRKSGAGLDLPIALGILAAGDAALSESLADRGFCGELALDGRLRATRGALAAVLALRQAGLREVVVPEAAAGRAALVPGIRVCGAADLAAVLAHLAGEAVLPASESLPEGSAGEGTGMPCLSEVRGQVAAKRALLVAAAGGHGLLLSGPPGTGKTLLAKRMPGLLPPLDEREQLETLCIHDAADPGAVRQGPGSDRPFRAPHHSASAAGLLGGGRPITPGEVSLAHHGVLFLDELPEFDRRCLESLREVMDQGVVRIARAELRCELPARFQLLAAANPCPCGHYGSPNRDCRCDDAALARYRRRLSGPLLDRIDLAVMLRPVPWSELSGGAAGPASAELRGEVARARARQQARAGVCNAAIPDAVLESTVGATDEALALLGRAVERFGLSARGARRVLRVARTLADLAGRDDTDAEAMAEAIGLRLPD